MPALATRCLGGRAAWAWVVIGVSAAAACVSAQPLYQPTDVALQEPPPPGEAAPADPVGDDLLDLDLDQLAQADVRVTAVGEVGLDTVVSTVSRTDVAVRQTPSAVYVVTQEMIRRSGARNLMEVLRTVPGVHVARVNANTWAVSSRGFNGAFSDKLLVQIDGRPIYNQFFSGVFWEHQMLPLHDIERIEVTRGPGGSVWGANAVNGIINVVTKDTQDTTGVYAEAGGGDEHRSFSHARVGGRLGAHATYRVYGAHIQEDAGLLPPGEADDARRGEQVGFRVDWRPTCEDVLTLQGDLTDLSQSLGADGNDIALGNFLGRWTRQVDADTDWLVQAYYDRIKLDYAAGSPLAEAVWQDAFDVDAQWHARRGAHDFVCGVGYRRHQTQLINTPGQGLNFNPDAASFDNASCFVQDTLTLEEDLLFLTLGCKFDQNDFVGFIYQPAVKAAVTPDERTSLWGSVSRAVRTPSVTNRDIQFIAPIGGGQFLRVNGSRSVNEEQAISYEIGLRRQPTDRFYWDLAVYFCRYEDLVHASPTGVTPPFVNGIFSNYATADTYGGELWGALEVAAWQRLRASYSYYREVFDERGVSSFGLVNTPGGYPRNMVYLASSTDVTQDLQVDVGLRYVDALTEVGGYLELDCRLALGLANGMELAVVGQNLLNASHREFVEPTGIGSTTGVQRGVYGVLSWDY